VSSEVVTLIAAIIAAITSVASLVLNSRLIVLREKRIMLWQKELDRLLELEKDFGVWLQRILGSGFYISTFFQSVESKKSSLFHLP
jgi:hypothetical protein